MMLEVTQAAEDELFEAFRWYERIRSGLGHELYDDFEFVAARIKRHPSAAPLVTRDVRQTSLERFPYYVYYSVNNDVIVVVAVSHHSRRPFYWLHRFG